MEGTPKGWTNPPRKEQKWPDRRDTPPDGWDEIEYGRKVATFLPCSHLTRRETYGLRCYIESLRERISALEDDLK